MAIALSDDAVGNLQTALRNGHSAIDALMGTLKGEAVQGVQAGLAGTETSKAFEERVTRFEASLINLTPQLEELGQFVMNYMEQFHEADRAQAQSLR